MHEMGITLEKIAVAASSAAAAAVAQSHCTNSHMQGITEQ